MIGMKFDMSGAAAVLEATGAIAELRPADRGRHGDRRDREHDRHAAMQVDDIVTAANGKTIEITNTDAEGRLVLADCLHHARSLGATHVVDLATLTGGVVIALGDLPRRPLGRDEELVDRIDDASASGPASTLWRMPLHDTYKRLFRSEIADMANASTMRTRAGACYAASFLQEFAGEGAWAHLDIAGTADLARSPRRLRAARAAPGSACGCSSSWPRRSADDAGLRPVRPARAAPRDGARRSPRGDRRRSPRSSTARAGSRSSWCRQRRSWGCSASRCPRARAASGLDTLAYAIAIEELARVDSSFAITVAAHTSLGTMPIHLFGSDEQKRRVAARPGLRPRLGRSA